MLEILMILLLQPTVFILHQNDRNPLCENIIESEKRLHNSPLETLATRIYLTLSHNIGEEVMLEQILIIRIHFSIVTKSVISRDTVISHDKITQK